MRSDTTMDFIATTKFGISLITITVVIASTLQNSYAFGCPAECVCSPEGTGQHEDYSAASSGPLLKIACEWPHIPGSNIFSTFPHKAVYKLSIQCKNTFPRSRYVGAMFASFTALRHLTIRNCHSEDSGLPSGLLQGLTKLKTLHLEAVSMPGLKLHLDTGVFVGAPAMERLTLSYSNLADLPGNLMCHFKDLKQLNLSHNDIRDLGSIGYGGNGECDNQLVILDLSNNRIAQLDGSALKSMNFLHILRLQGNDVGAIEQGAFSGLPRLQELYIGQNNITRVEDLPPAAQILDLADNRLRTFPVAVRHHQNLIHLNLSGNQLFESDSPLSALQFGDQLTILDLSRNRLQRVRTEFFENATNLQHLYLSQNRLEELESNAFKNTPRLRYLDLSDNRILGLRKEHLNGLQNLSELILDNNKIDSIADDAFAATPQLRQLSISSNTISQAPTALTLLYYLQRLDLSRNRIATIPKFLFDKLPNLRELRLSANQIRTIERYIFEKLPALNLLDLSNNRIEQLATNCFEGTAAIKLLRLDGNDINDIQGNFVGLPQLQSLNLSSNRIAYIDFAMLPIGLRSLYAANNSITHVSNVLLHHQRRQPQLLILDLSQNKIKQLNGDMLPNSIEMANFNRNMITRIEDGTASDKVNLSVLDLGHNHLEEVRLEAVKSKNTATTSKLSLIGNPLRCTCNNEWIRTNLQHNDFKPKPRFHDSALIPRITDYDELTCALPWSIEDPFLLKDVDVDKFLCEYDTSCTKECMCCDFDSCDCKSVCPEGCHCFHDFKHKSNVVRCEKQFEATAINVRRKIPMHATKIDLSRTEIAELPSNSFFARFKLRQLYLNRSGLQTIADDAFNGLTTLEVLDLSFNQLENIRGHEFKNLSKLHRLLLSDNRLETIPEALFERLPALRDLSLHNNRFVTLPTSIVNYSPTLASMTLSGNPWKCDCDPNRYIFQKWLPENTVLVPDYGTVYCADNVLPNGQPSQSVLNATNSSTALSILPVLAIGQTVIKVNFWTFVSGINVTFCRPPSLSADGSALATRNPAYSEAGKDNATAKTAVESGRESLSIMFICVAVAIAVLIIVLVLIIWRYKNHLRCKYSKYSTTGSSSVNSSRTTATTPIPLLQFDAFVSYSAEEQAFVMNEITNRLEQDHPYYNLCLLYRDLPTSPCADRHRIDDKIITSMERSQRVITVVTRNFLDKEWKSTQLRTAYQYLTKENKRKPMIVIVVDDLPDDVDSFLGHYMRINRCLRWNDPMFWQKFQEAMPERSVQQESATLSNSSHYSDVYGTIVPSRFV